MVDSKEAGSVRFVTRMPFIQDAKPSRFEWGAIFDQLCKLVELCKTIGNPLYAIKPERCARPPSIPMNVHDDPP
jgi:hypothetical protein